MLGLLPDLIDMPQINQALAIPLRPTRPPNAIVRGPTPTTAPAEAATKIDVGPNRPNLTIPATVLPPAISRPGPDIRRQTEHSTPTRAPMPAPVLSTLAISQVDALEVR
jgi:hypothetical protein